MGSGKSWGYCCLGIATRSSILAGRMLWTEEPGWLWSTGSQRVGHDWSDGACRCVGLVLNIPCKFISLKSMWMDQPLAASPGALQNPQDLGHISSRLYLAGLEGNLYFRILKHFPTYHCSLSYNATSQSFQTEPKKTFYLPSLSLSQLP